MIDYRLLEARHHVVIETENSERKLPGEVNGYIARKIDELTEKRLNLQPINNNNARIANTNDSRNAGIFEQHQDTIMAKIIGTNGRPDWKNRFPQAAREMGMVLDDAQAINLEIQNIQNAGNEAKEGKIEKLIKIVDADLIKQLRIIIKNNELLEGKPFADDKAYQQAQLELAKAQTNLEDVKAAGRDTTWANSKVALAEGMVASTTQGRYEKAKRIAENEKVNLLGIKEEVIQLQSSEPITA